jgi:hypothetical protein
MFAQPHLVWINIGFTGDFSLLLSNNHSTGGSLGDANSRLTSGIKLRVVFSADISRCHIHSGTRSRQDSGELR